MKDFYYKSLCNKLCLVGFNVNIIDSDDVISEGSEELGTSGAPSQSGTGISVGSVSGGLFLLGLFNDELGNWVIGVRFQIEDMDTSFGGSSNPSLTGVEGNLVDGGTSVQDSLFFSEVFSVPDLDDVFFTTSGDVVTHGGNGEGVDVFLMSLERVLDQEVRVPDLKSTIPTDGGEVGVLGNGRVSDAGDPVGVVVGFVGVLAVSKSVPELEASVSTSGDDLSVVLGESDGMDFLGVANEVSGGSSGSQIPKSEGSVPRGGQSEQVVRGEGNIGDEVVVTSQGLQGDTVESVGISFVDFFDVTSDLPDHEGSVSGTSDNDVGFLSFFTSDGVASGDGSNPVSVTFEVTDQSELRSDFFVVFHVRIG
jgi:hypothetical protein